ncbi:hypothetical protein [Clavibacter michiganensis]|uniref:hypothetical protein n=1 Tax=Clavibacter michiganensis TaxID=28447 RepID=UPI0005B8F412|nr:hypothetical protein [Clavibacter michiganensis]
MPHRIARTDLIRPALAAGLIAGALALVPITASSAPVAAPSASSASLDASLSRVPTGPGNSIGPGLHY